MAEIPEPSIILFWAVWCAPCQKEIASLDELDRAAAPVPVLIAPMEDDARSRDALGGIDPKQMRFQRFHAFEWMQRATGGSAGLPASVAVNAKGQICGIARRALTPERIGKWRVQCGWTAPPASPPPN
ncbi:hypothetical protein GCM10023219_05380 [Stakelama sediminis]|uniref:Thiol-disulfide isomerase/thioredoxin n=1 Tax=Stakelama sediminis TaxID=463200 RepID=A0A840YUM9_9SPHN|nr:thiol-disulfide isomerase/thioredoxin [Stakelama sediminis]